MKQDLLSASTDLLRRRLPHPPQVAVITGTGLGALADVVEDPVVIPYDEIPGFVASTAPSHAGQMVGGMVRGCPVVVLQGRIHYYEGFGMEKVAWPVRVLQRLGVKTLALTNAAGSLNRAMQPGDIVMLDDHINLMGANPLIGLHDDAHGERFPSMHQPYDQDLRRQFRSLAKRHGVRVAHGVYAAVSGPNLETRAECRMLASLGADLVGMSTVPETIVAVQAGMRVLALSIVSNYGNLFHNERHTQDEIRRHAATAGVNLSKILSDLLAQLSERE
ncbi:MAG: purine-nucleoside phosphorylase [Candidatus Cloacimonetes bacterium]|nr:purine-nucleoside phosphorylase [Candidatus Cloacimonadota bacterium]